MFVRAETVPSLGVVQAPGAMPMLEEVLDWWQFNFWFGASCLLAGIVVVLPLLLSRTFRKWFDRSDIDLEFIGLIQQLSCDRQVQAPSAASTCSSSRRRALTMVSSLRTQATSATLPSFPRTRSCW